MHSLYEGLIEASNMANITIAGGDTSTAKELVLNIVLYGEATQNNPVRRKGAKIGDTIYVTGTLGDSIAGLEILLKGDSDKVNQFPALIKKHKRPLARFDLMDGILSEFSPTAMIDISDGLLSDLGHICESSSMGTRAY